MSGPLSTSDLPPDRAAARGAQPQAVELIEAREARVGALTVRRALPKARRRTVGAWCFVDHVGPLAIDVDDPLGIGPHPHIGLSTVTYLLDGQLLHRDSLGSEQLLRPGQLNLMTAGRGVSHAEEPTGRYAGPMLLAQLWIAQPEATRHGEPAFVHHAELPRVELPGAEATVLVGDFAGASSAASTDTPLLGVALDLPPGGTELPLELSFEHLLVVLDGTVVLADEPVQPGRSGYLAPGRSELALSAPDGARVLLLGGPPFPEQLVMWWNFVGRSRDEVAEAGRQWTAGDDRFGRVDTPAPRVPVPSSPL